jgi:hypothetical protein
MRLRSALVPALAVAAVAALAAPAFAHEEITPKTISTGQSAFLSLTAANESSSDLVKIVLKAPANLSLGKATRSPAGWSATADGDAAAWTGALKPGTFETFGFEVGGPDQPGTLTFSVTSTNAAGRTDEHEVEITAAAPGTAGGPTPATAGTATSVTTATTAAPTSPTTAAAAAGDAADDSDGASVTAKAALALSMVALLLAGGSLAMGARGRRGTASPGGGSTPGAAQDW